MLSRLMGVVLVLVMIGGVVVAATFNPAAPSQRVEKVIADERFPK